MESSSSSSRKKRWELEEEVKRREEEAMRRRKEEEDRLEMEALPRRELRRQERERLLREEQSDTRKKIFFSSVPDAVVKLTPEDEVLLQREFPPTIRFTSLLILPSAFEFVLQRLRERIPVKDWPAKYSLEDARSENWQMFLPIICVMMELRRIFSREDVQLMWDFLVFDTVPSIEYALYFDLPDTKKEWEKVLRKTKNPTVRARLQNLPWAVYLMTEQEVAEEWIGLLEILNPHLPTASDMTPGNFVTLMHVPQAWVKEFIIDRINQKTKRRDIFVHAIAMFWVHPMLFKLVYQEIRQTKRYPPWIGDRCPRNGGLYPFNTSVMVALLQQDVPEFGKEQLAGLVKKHVRHEYIYREGMIRRSDQDYQEFLTTVRNLALTVEMVLGGTTTSDGAKIDKRRKLKF